MALLLMMIIMRCWRCWLLLLLVVVMVMVLCCRRGSGGAGAGGGGGCSNDIISNSLLLHVLLAVQPRGISAHILREIRQADIVERNTTRIVAAIEALGIRSLVRRRTLHTFAAFVIGLACLKRSVRHCGGALTLCAIGWTACRKRFLRLRRLRREQRELFESGGVAPRPAVDHVGGDAGPRSPVPPAPPAPPRQAAFNPRTYEVPSAMR